VSFQCNFAGGPVINLEKTMKSEPIQNLLRELVWRRKLTETEQAGLREQPETRADLEFESRLTEGLAQLPDAAMPSNFTARVLQAVERETALRPQPTVWQWSWRVLVPRLAVGAAVIGLAGLAYQRHEFNQRARLAKNVALAAEAQPMPSVDALKNFNAIQRMGQSHADEKLLALLQ
jgi:hypothetical protein